MKSQLYRGYLLHYTGCVSKPPRDLHRAGRVGTRGLGPHFTSGDWVLCQARGPGAETSHTNFFIIGRTSRTDGSTGELRDKGTPPPTPPPACMTLGADLDAKRRAKISQAGLGRLNSLHCPGFRNHGSGLARQFQAHTDLGLKTGLAC